MYPLYYKLTVTSCDIAAVAVRVGDDGEFE